MTMVFVMAAVDAASGWAVCFYESFLNALNKNADTWLYFISTVTMSLASITHTIHDYYNDVKQY